MHQAVPAGLKSPDGIQVSLLGKMAGAAQTSNIQLRGPAAPLREASAVFLLYAGVPLASASLLRSGGSLILIERYRAALKDSLGSEDTLEVRMADFDSLANFALPLARQVGGAIGSNPFYIVLGILPVIAVISRDIPTLLGSLLGFGAAVAALLGFAPVGAERFGVPGMLAFTSFLFVLLGFRQGRLRARISALEQRLVQYEARVVRIQERELLRSLHRPTREETVAGPKAVPVRLSV